MNLFRKLFAVALTTSIVSSCGTELDANMDLLPEVQTINAQAAKKPVDKNYVPLKPGEGEQFDFVWHIYAGRDKTSLDKTRKAYDTFMKDHVSTSDIAKVVITEPVQWYSGKHSAGGGYFIEAKLYGVSDKKALKKVISRDLEKYLGYDKAYNYFKLYDDDWSFVGPGTFIRW